MGSGTDNIEEFLTEPMTEEELLRKLQAQTKVELLEAGHKLYTSKQVKAITLTFFDAFPKHDSLHMPSIFDAWFEKYGSRL